MLDLLEPEIIRRPVVAKDRLLSVGIIRQEVGSNCGFLEKMVGAVRFELTTF